MRFRRFVSFRSVPFGLCTRRVCVLVCVVGSALCLSIDDRNAHLFMSFNCAHCSAMRCCVWGRMDLSIEHGKPQSNMGTSTCLIVFMRFFRFLLHCGMKSVERNDGETALTFTNIRRYVSMCEYFSIQFAVSVVWWTLLTREQIRAVSHCASI